MLPATLRSSKESLNEIDIEGHAHEQSGMKTLHGDRGRTGCRIIDAGRCKFADLPNVVAPGDLDTTVEDFAAQP